MIFSAKRGVKMYSSKKAQIGFDITAIAIVLIFIFIIAPIALKMTTSVTSKFSSAINPISNKSANTVAAIETKFTSWWDTVIMIAIVGNIILLIISSFLVFVHPAFILVFILMSMLTMIFVPQLLNAPDAVWSNQGIATVTPNLPMTQFVMEHFGAILLAVIILVGIILYTKFQQNRTYG